MSYCRCGEDSDVYLFCGLKYEFHISNMASKHALSGFTCDTASEALSKLLELRDDGLKVPDYAIRRLHAEVANEHS